MSRWAICSVSVLFVVQTLFLLRGLKQTCVICMCHVSMFPWPTCRHVSFQDFASFLTSHSSIQQFCAQEAIGHGIGESPHLNCTKLQLFEVDPMTTEADHLQIMALSSYLAVPARVPLWWILPSLLPWDGVCVTWV